MRAGQNKYPLHDLIYIKFRKYKLNYSDKRPISRCLGTKEGMGKGIGKGLQRDMKKLLGMMDMSMLLSVMMLHGCIHVSTLKLCT